MKLHNTVRMKYKSLRKSNTSKEILHSAKKKKGTVTRYTAVSTTYRIVLAYVRNEKSHKTVEEGRTQIKQKLLTKYF